MYKSNINQGREGDEGGKEDKPTNLDCVMGTGGAVIGTSNQRRRRRGRSGKESEKKKCVTSKKEKVEETKK